MSPITQLVVVQLEASTGKGVGLDDVRAGLQIRPVNTANSFRLGKCKDLGAAIIGRAAIIGSTKPKILNHRPHGAVENHHALSHRVEIPAQHRATPYLSRRHL